MKWFSIPKPRIRRAVHRFDGEHYWEVGKAGYSVKRVLDDFKLCAAVQLVRSYRVDENPYHRFFVFGK
jgi:hypothetical protein